VDLEELIIRFGSVGSQKTAADIKRLQAVITPAMGKMIASFKTLKGETDELNKALGRLSRRDVNVSVNVDSVAGHIVELDKLEQQLKDIQGRWKVQVAASSTGSVGDGGDGAGVGISLDGQDGDGNSRYLSSLIGLTSGLTRGLAGIAGSVVTTTALAGALTGAGVAAGVLGQSLIAVGGGAVTGIVGGLTASTLALAGAFTTAGLGVGAFGVLAVPTLKKVTEAHEAFSKATDAYDAAKAAGDARAMDAALEAQRAAYVNLTPAQRGAAEGIQALGDTWRSAAAQLEPTTLDVFGRGLSVLDTLLPQLVPAAEAAGAALSDLLTKVEAGLRGEDFAEFLSVIEQESPKLIGQFGDIGIGMSVAMAKGLENGMPLIHAVMDGLVVWSDQLRNAFEGDTFKGFVQFGIDMLPHLGNLFSELGGLVVAFGQAFAPLAPIATDILAGLASSLADVFSGSGMDAFVGGAITMLPLVGEALKSLGGGVGSLITALAPLGPIVTNTLGELGEALSRVFESDAAAGFVEALGELLPKLIPPLEILAESFLMLIGTVGKGLSPVLDGLTKGLEVLAPAFESFVTGAVGLLGPLLETLLPRLGEFLALLIGDSGLGGAMKSWGGSMEVLMPLLDSLLGGVIAFTEAVLPAFGAIRDAIAAAMTPEVVASLQSAFESLGTTMGTLGEIVAILIEAAAPLIPVFVEAVAAILEGLAPALEAAAVGLKIVAELIAPLIELVADLAGVVVDIADGALSAFGGMMSDVADGARQVADDLGNIDWGAFLDSITDAFADAGTWLLEAGRDIVRGLVSGIGDLAMAPVDALKGIGGDMIGGFKDLFDINSPSRLMTDLGEYLPQGLALGVTKGKKSVDDAWSSLTSGFSAPAVPGFADLAGGFTASANTSRTVQINAAGTYFGGYTRETAPDGSVEEAALKALEEQANGIAEALNNRSEGAQL
jgi:phage-related protein